MDGMETESIRELEQAVTLYGLPQIATDAIGDTVLTDIKNEVAKQLVIKMRAAMLADKTIVNYFQVVRAVVASALSSEGEQLYPRNLTFISSVFRS